MSKIIATLFFIIFIAIGIGGCASTTPIQVTFDENISHPELPNPVQPYQFKFYVVTESNVESFVNQDKAYVAIEYQETLEFRQFLEDMKRFMLEANGVICYYRVDLQEQFCANQIKYLERNTVKE